MMEDEPSAYTGYDSYDEDETMELECKVVERTPCSLCHKIWADKQLYTLLRFSCYRADDKQLQVYVVCLRCLMVWCSSVLPEACDLLIFRPWDISVTGLQGRDSRRMLFCCSCFDSIEHEIHGKAAETVLQGVLWSLGCSFQSFLQPGTRSGCSSPSHFGLPLPRVFRLCLGS